MPQVVERLASRCHCGVFHQLVQDTLRKIIALYLTAELIFESTYLVKFIIPTDSFTQETNGIFLPIVVFFRLQYQLTALAARWAELELKITK